MVGDEFRHLDAGDATAAFDRGATSAYGPIAVAALIAMLVLLAAIQVIQSAA